MRCHSEGFLYARRRAETDFAYKRLSNSRRSPRKFAETSLFSDNENKTTARLCSLPACHFLAIACNCSCVISCFSVLLLFRLLMLCLVLIEVLTEKAYHKAEYAIPFAFWERAPSRGAGQSFADGLCKVFHLRAEGADLYTHGTFTVFPFGCLFEFVFANSFHGFYFLCSCSLHGASNGGGAKFQLYASSTFLFSRACRFLRAQGLSRLCPR